MALIKFPLDELIGEGPVRQSEFRRKIDMLDLEPYRDQAVLIPWMHGAKLPIWIYLMVTAKLADIAAVLSYGEACSPVVLRQRARIKDSNPSNSNSLT